ncbi:MAG TPA: hypothetical protein VK507_19220 [Iamia sp.]|nr:hypothetical protein [Iamia sp.]
MASPTTTTLVLTTFQAAEVRRVVDSDAAHGSQWASLNGRRLGISDLDRATESVADLADLWHDRAWEHSGQRARAKSIDALLGRLHMLA